MKAEVFEASGLLEALGLTLIRPRNTNVVCAMCKGSTIDYALVTSTFAATVKEVEAVKTTEQRQQVEAHLATQGVI